MLHAGSASLSDEDLLALVMNQRRVGPEFVRRLLFHHDGLVGLAGRDALELVRSGLAPGSATRMAAVFELARRVSQARRRTRQSLKTPEEVVAALSASLVGKPHEELWCLPLDPKSQLIGEPRITSMGDVDGTDATPRAFFRIALSAGATSAIAVHNHPAGDPSPSAADRSATRRLVLGGRLVDLPLVDHIVLGDGCRFASLRRIDSTLFV